MVTLARLQHAPRNLCRLLAPSCATSDSSERAFCSLGSLQAQLLCVTYCSLLLIATLLTTAQYYSLLYWLLCSLLCSLLLTTTHYYSLLLTTLLTGQCRCTQWCRSRVGTISCLGKSRNPCNHNSFHQDIFGL